MTAKTIDKQSRIAPPPPADAPLKEGIHENPETTRKIVEFLDAALLSAKSAELLEDCMYGNDIRAAITLLHRARENYFDSDWEAKLEAHGSNGKFRKSGVQANSAPSKSDSKTESPFQKESQAEAEEAQNELI